MADGEAVCGRISGEVARPPGHHRRETGLSGLRLAGKLPIVRGLRFIFRLAARHLVLKLGAATLNCGHASTLPRIRRFPAGGRLPLYGLDSSQPSGMGRLRLRRSVRH